MGAAGGCDDQVGDEDGAVNAAGAPRPYRPSNGTEGEGFHEAFCYRCLHFDECEILTRAQVLLPGDPDFPAEWVTGGSQGPRCTAFELETDDPELAAARRDPRQQSLPL